MNVQSMTSFGEVGEIESFLVCRMAAMVFYTTVWHRMKDIENDVDPEEDLEYCFLWDLVNALEDKFKFTAHELHSMGQTEHQ